jgi:hypothetical protein
MKGKLYLALLGMLAMAGCVTPPMTPQEMRAMVKDQKGMVHVKVDTFVVNRPYAVVSQYIKRKSNECLNKEFKVTSTQSCGFMSTCEYDHGTTKYIPVSNIGAKSAEFYTKYWSSEKNDGKPDGDRSLLSLADVTPKGSGTSITLYTFDFDHYQWTRDIIKAWAKGEDPGCPLLTGEY